MFAFLFTETEHNNRIVILQHDHLDNLVDIRRCYTLIIICRKVHTIVALTTCAAFPSFAFLTLSKYSIWIITFSVFEYRHCFLEILFSEFTAIVYDKENPVSACGEEIMLEWSWSEICVHDMTGLSMSFCDPLSELQCIGDGSR